MVELSTNHPEFFNDLAEVVRLYLPDARVLPECGAQRQAGVLLHSVGGALFARAFCNMCGRRAEYEYRLELPPGCSGLVLKRMQKRALKIALFRALGRVESAFLPWGSLTGIRPTRLLRELEAELSPAGAERFMLQEFDVSPEKLRLAQEINGVQHGLLAKEGAAEADVYIGVPYCKTRCLYCSFLSEVRTAKTNMEAYLAALVEDIRLGAQTARRAGLSIRAMYMGGGTPTVLTAGELGRVLEAALSAYGGFGREFTVEAGRPDTITAEKLKVIRSFGAGRISINPQSMNEKTLAVIGRSHTPAEIEQAFALARGAGFGVINMDVIAGLPGEGEAEFCNSLERVAKLGPENITVHTLAIKRSSALKGALGSYPLAGPQEAEAMVAAGGATARGLGMRPYYMYRQKYMRGNLENVGYALPGTECVYNVDMMEETTSILAHGAGSMAKRIFPGEHRVERIPHPKDVGTYIAKLPLLAAEREKLFLGGGQHGGL